MMLRIPAVKREQGHRSDASVYNHVRAGLLTRPVRIGTRAVAWPEHEVKAINSARIAGFTDDQLRQLVDQLHAKRADLVPVI